MFSSLTVEVSEWAKSFDHLGYSYTEYIHGFDEYFHSRMSRHPARRSPEMPFPGFKIPFGYHKGKFMRDVPPDSLSTFSKLPYLHKETRQIVESHLQWMVEYPEEVMWPLKDKMYWKNGISLSRRNRLGDIDPGYIRWAAETFRDSFFTREVLIPLAKRLDPWTGFPEVSDNKDGGFDPADIQARQEYIPQWKYLSKLEVILPIKKKDITSSKTDAGGHTHPKFEWVKRSGQRLFFWEYTPISNFDTEHREILPTLYPVELHGTRPSLWNLTRKYDTVTDELIDVGREKYLTFPVLQWRYIVVPGLCCRGHYCTVEYVYKERDPDFQSFTVRNYKSSSGWKPRTEDPQTQERVSIYNTLLSKIERIGDGLIDWDDLGTLLARVGDAGKALLELYRREKEEIIPVLTDLCSAVRVRELFSELRREVQRVTEEVLDRLKDGEVEQFQEWKETTEEWEVEEEETEECEDLSTVDMDLEEEEDTEEEIVELEQTEEVVEGSEIYYTEDFEEEMEALEWEEWIRNQR